MLCHSLVHSLVTTTKWNEQQRQSTAATASTHSLVSGWFQCRSFCVSYASGAARPLLRHQLRHGVHHQHCPPWLSFWWAETTNTTSTTSTTGSLADSLTLALTFPRRAVSITQPCSLQVTPSNHSSRHLSVAQHPAPQARILCKGSSLLCRITREWLRDERHSHIDAAG